MDMAIIMGVFLALGVLFWLMTRVYQVHPKPHTETPRSLGIDFEEIRIPTRNNLSLYGWWIPASGKAGAPLIILMHGWKRNVERMLPYIGMLQEEYNLLAIDARNHGRSDSDSYVSMPRFSEDIRSAVDFVQGRLSAGTCIGVIGLSIGGSAAIHAASRDHRIRFVATVGAFAHPATVMHREFKKRYIPYFPMVWLLFEYIQFRMGERFDTIAPEKVIGKSEALFLLIHGTGDQTTPVGEATKLLNAAAPGKAELWTPEGYGHSDCHEHPGFRDRLLRFIRVSCR